MNATLEQGYLAITREWRAGDTVELNLPMPVRTVRSHPQVAALRGRVAFERGPVVYCVEEEGKKTGPSEWVAPAVAEISAVVRPDLLGGVTVLADAGAHFMAIPYYAWNNRGLAPMAVWLREPAAGNLDRTAR